MKKTKTPLMMVVIAVMCIMASCNNTKPKEPEVVETKDTTEGINLEDGDNYEPTGTEQIAPILNDCYVLIEGTQNPVSRATVLAIVGRDTVSNTITAADGSTKINLRPDVDNTIIISAARYRPFTQTGVRPKTDVHKFYLRRL
jgi:hypothetical protein